MTTIDRVSSTGDVPRLVGCQIGEDRRDFLRPRHRAAVHLRIQQRQKLDVLRQQFPELGQLAKQREALRGLFEDATIGTPAAGRERLQTWLVQARSLGSAALEKFFTTLTNWLDLIANYFQSRSSNGRTEGLNHGLRAILWRAFGMTNFHNFRSRVLHAFGFSKTESTSLG